MLAPIRMRDSRRLTYDALGTHRAREAPREAPSAQRTLEHTVGGENMHSRPCMDTPKQTLQTMDTCTKIVHGSMHQPLQQPTPRNHAQSCAAPRPASRPPPTATRPTLPSLLSSSSLTSSHTCRSSSRTQTQTHTRVLDSRHHHHLPLAPPTPPHDALTTPTSPLSRQCASASRRLQPYAQPRPALPRRSRPPRAGPEASHSTSRPTAPRPDAPPRAVAPPGFLRH